MPTNELRDAILSADHCHAFVMREGTSDACGKRPVAIIDGRNGADQCYWPACAYHANRNAPTVVLAEIVEALR